jgi:hypothetical protein
MHLQVGDPDDVRLPLRPSAEDGPDAGEQFGEGERLGQVVVGPEVQPPDPVLHLPAAGETQDGGAAVGGTQLLQHPPAAAVWQVDVQNDEVVAPPGRHPEAHLSQDLDVHDVPVLGQPLAEVRDGVRLVFDQQHFHERPPTAGVGSRRVRARETSR